MAIIYFTQLYFAVNFVFYRTVPCFCSVYRFPAILERPFFCGSVQRAHIRVNTNEKFEYISAVAIPIVADAKYPMGATHAK